jgi:N-ethylmaleimide reductase
MCRSLPANAPGRNGSQAAMLCSRRSPGRHPRPPLTPGIRYAEELAKRRLAYLHVLEALPGHFFYVEDHPPILPALRRAFPGILIANCGYGEENAAALVAGGGADVVAFGTLLLANPDLVTRFRTGAKLNVPEMATFYSPGSQGYTDYPFAKG